MRSHLTEDMLAEGLEGLGSPEARRHLAECGECAQRLDEARSGLEMASAAGVPEPPPLYWEVFRRQVGRRISEEAPARRSFGFWLCPALAGAVAVVIAIGLLRPPADLTGPRRRPRSTLVGSAPGRRGRGTGGPRAVAADGGDALAAALPSEGVAGTLSGLSDEESDVLAHRLQDEMSGDTL
jgi:hypothetical protein